MENYFGIEALQTTGPTYPNPVEDAGIAHNEVLTHISGESVLADLEGSYQAVISYMTSRYDVSADEFLPWGEISESFSAIIADGYGEFVAMKDASAPKVATALGRIHDAILNSETATDFESLMDTLVSDLLADEEMSDQDKCLALGAVALAVHSTRYWNAQVRGDIFGDTPQAKKKGPFWADVGGFVGGFVGTLVYNNNNGSGGDLNPFANGAAVGGLASAAAKELKD